MHARSTTITGRPEAVDQGIAFMRDEVEPAMTAMDGCLGLSLVVDRLSGRCIASSAWETEESMALAGDALSPFRTRAAVILGGEPEVDRWEIAAMHRVQPAGEGAWCRIIWSRPQDVHIHVMLERFRNPLLRQIEALGGFCSISLFVDRLERRICTTTTYESRASLDASADSSEALRKWVARDTGIEFLEIGEFELALSRLRVPELA
jgi:quinol monooxygenase YgiN